jgi:hypothetical protein
MDFEGSYEKYLFMVVVLMVERKRRYLCWKHNFPT